MYIIIDTCFTEEGEYQFSFIQDATEDYAKARRLVALDNYLRGGSKKHEDHIVWSEGDLLASLKKYEATGDFGCLACDWYEVEDAKSCAEIAEAWEGGEASDLDAYLYKHHLSEYSLTEDEGIVSEVDFDGDWCMVKIEASDEDSYDNDYEERWTEWYTSR